MESVTYSFLRTCCRPSPVSLALRSLSAKPRYRLFNNSISLGSWSSLERGREKPYVAVLFQAVDPPVINGVCKPPKPGGYQDSGADIAFALQRDLNVVTQSPNPDPASDSGWCFPDNEDGIILAIQKGANILWANTILFESHPLQNSSRLDKYQKTLRVVGQPPRFVEIFDDKRYLNSQLYNRGSFTIPQSWVVSQDTHLETFLTITPLSFPIVGKPVRGRGSHGVKVCHSSEELYQHVQSLFKESFFVMLEEFLSGEEATVTVIPPSIEKADYWAMPVVTRFNHLDGIAPYSGAVAVTKNSRVITLEEYEKDIQYKAAAQECVAVARLLQATAPIRIDIRRYDQDPRSKFALFDINMKPNMTGPGRPGRENQASLTVMAATALGWNYSTLLKRLLSTARTLEELRTARHGVI